MSHNLSRSANAKQIARNTSAKPQFRVTGLAMWMAVSTLETGNPSKTGYPSAYPSI